MAVTSVLRHFLALVNFIDSTDEFIEYYKQLFYMIKLFTKAVNNE
tara:strand:- start:357 stop:491 length:135 start_codon:yes stop_codon:yes gene_type:complete